MCIGDTSGVADGRSGLFSCGGSGEVPIPITAQNSFVGQGQFVGDNQIFVDLLAAVDHKIVVGTGEDIRSSLIGHSGLGLGGAACDISGSFSGSGKSDIGITLQGLRTVDDSITFHGDRLVGHGQIAVKSQIGISTAVNSGAAFVGHQTFIGSVFLKIAEGSGTAGVKS